MVEKSGNYPAYQSPLEKLLDKTVMASLDYEQLLEIANIFYYVNKVSARTPRWLGGIRLTEAKRALHKSIHDAAVNCLLSIEAADRHEREGNRNHE